MKATLQQTQFESLSARLLDGIAGIDDAQSMLQQACRLLKGQLALLAKLEPIPSAAPALISTYPTDEHGWAEACLDEFRTWYREAELPATARGFPSESPITAGGREFSDALVAYGGRPSDRGRYELIVLRQSPSEVPYSHYHCALAAGLLIAYELIARTRESIQKTEEARNARANMRLYAGLLSTNVLPNETWSDFLNRVEQEDQKKPNDSEFMCRAALLWTGYAVRKADRSVEGFDPAEARDWIKTHFAESASDALTLMGFLLDSPIASPAKAHANSAKRLIDARYEFGMGGLLLLLEAAWHRVYKATQQATGSFDTSLAPSSAPSADSVKGTVKQAQGPSGALAASDAGRRSQNSWCEPLLHLTSMIVAEGLIQAARAPACPSRQPRTTEQTCSDAACETHLDREVLRMYFALLVAGASRIRRRYLWLGEDDPRRVPPEVRREFLLNLSRFMLGVIASLQRRNNVDVDPGGVSTVEVLDALLYIVDRYAHVELEVERRLNIREHLARGMKMEVQRHMRSGFYRDHLLHVIDVFLLGHLLLDAKVHWLKSEQKDLLTHLSDIMPHAAVGNAADVCRQNWAVASLLHDMGYQVNLKSSGSGLMEEFKKYFVLPKVGSREPRLDPAGLGSDGDRDDCVRFVKNLAKQITNAHSEAQWLEDLVKKAPEDHGVLSALRVAQLLAHADSQESGDEHGPLPLLGTYLPALHAMAHHNLFGRTVKLEKEPLSCILRLCDELQEWERQRVDIEKVVKRLYLAIEEGETDAMPDYGILDRLGTNLVFEKNGKTVDQESIEEVVVTVPAQGCELRFVLHYRSPIKARYDPITSFLSKAYSFQHVDLNTVSIGGLWPMKWYVRMLFPRPREYRGITELDIYGIISQQVRDLPDLWHFDESRLTQAGMVRTGNDEPGIGAGQSSSGKSDTDQITILVSGNASARDRYGWLTFDPGPLIKTLVELKQQVLIKRTLGADGSWLGYS